MSDADRLVAYLVETEDSSQLAGFTSLAEAERARALLDAEQRHGPLFINGVPLHATVEDWQQER
jgi:hypothetical protein